MSECQYDPESINFSDSEIREHQEREIASASKRAREFKTDPQGNVYRRNWSGGGGEIDADLFLERDFVCGPLEVIARAYPAEWRGELWLPDFLGKCVLFSNCDADGLTAYVPWELCLYENSSRLCTELEHHGFRVNRKFKRIFTHIYFGEFAPSRLVAVPNQLPNNRITILSVTLAPSSKDFPHHV